MVEQKPSKLMTRVRFPSPAPICFRTSTFDCFTWPLQPALQYSGRAGGWNVSQDCRSCRRGRDVGRVCHGHKHALSRRRYDAAVHGRRWGFAPDARHLVGRWRTRVRSIQRHSQRLSPRRLAKTPEGQAYLRNTIAAKVKASIERKLIGDLTGSRPVRLRVTVKAVIMASAIQRVIVGGNHTMTADVTVVDAKTGAMLLPYELQSEGSRCRSRCRWRPRRCGVFRRPDGPRHRCLRGGPTAIGSCARSIPSM